MRRPLADAKHSENVDENSFSIPVNSLSVFTWRCLPDRILIHGADCFGKTVLVRHIPSSTWPEKRFNCQHDDGAKLTAAW